MGIEKIKEMIREEQQRERREIEFERIWLNIYNLNKKGVIAVDESKSSVKKVTFIINETTRAERHDYITLIYEMAKQFDAKVAKREESTILVEFPNFRTARAVRKSLK